MGAALGSARDAESSRDTESYRLVNGTDSELEDGPLSKEKLAIGDGNDIVQFSSPLYFVEEEEGKLSIDIMRLGSMKGAISVFYETLDASGKDGERYLAKSGTVLFRDGEFSKPIEIDLVQSDSWSATLEFKVQLSHPANCEMGKYLHTCRIKVIDGDCFPSNALETEIKAGPESVDNLNGFSLFWEYCKLNWQVPGVAWRTVLILVLDQMQNAYRFLLLALGVYIVDTLFKLDDPDSDSRLMLPDRAQTATLVGALYIVPMLVLHIWDLVKIKLNLDGLSLLYLQTNLVRKYLNFSEKSRISTPPGEVQDAILTSAMEVSTAYSAAISMVRLIGKLGVLTFFTLKENFAAWPYIVLMPSLMVIFGSLRSQVLQETNDKAGSKYSALLELVQEVCNMSKYRLIANYFQRPQMCDMFTAKADANMKVQIPAHFVKMNNGYFTKWLGPVFIGAYISMEAKAVFEGEVSLGTFLATINIFHQVSTDFGEGYQEAMKVLQTFIPLKRLTVMLNTETDVRFWKTVNRGRRQKTQQVREDLVRQKEEGRLDMTEVKFISDMIDLSLSEVVADGQKGEKLGNEGAVSFKVPQGSIVAITGGHGTGKSTLMRLIAHEIFPTRGTIFIPTFLRILHVSQEVILLNDSPWRNLVFGLQNPADVDPDRIVKLLDMLDAKRLKQMIAPDLERARRHRRGDYSTPASHRADDSDEEMGQLLQFCREEEVEDETDGGELGNWQNEMSYTEKVKLHLARAFLMNPEVMVLQRPLHHFDGRTGKKIFELLKEHSRSRGIALPEDQVSKRRPRTVFLTTESPDQDEMADIIFDLSTGKLEVNSETSTAASLQDQKAPPSYQRTTPGAHPNSGRAAVRSCSPMVQAPSRGGIKSRDLSFDYLAPSATKSNSYPFGPPVVSNGYGKS